MGPLLRSTAGMTANLRRGIAEFGRNEDTCEEDPRMRSRKLNQSRRCGPIPLEPPESTLSSRPTKLLEMSVPKRLSRHDYVQLTSFPVAFLNLAPWVSTCY